MIKKITLFYILALIIFGFNFGFAAEACGAYDIDCNNEEDNTDASDDSEFDKAWDNQNYDTAFELDPDGVEEKIKDDPEVIEGNEELLDTVRENSVDLLDEVLSDNLDLLEDPTVRQTYDQAVVEDNNLANGNPDLFNEFLKEEFDVEGGIGEGVSLVGYTDENIEFEGSNGNILLPKSVLTGTKIGVEGDLQLISGEVIYEGVISVENGVKQITASVGEEVAKIGYNDEIYTSKEMQFGYDDGYGSFFVQTLGENLIDFRNGEVSLAKGKLNAIGYDIVLREDSELKYYDVITTNNELDRREIVRSYSTDSDVRITSNTCKNLGNCIFESEDLLGIEVSQGINLDVNLYTNENIEVEVKPIDDSSVVKVSTEYDENKVEFEVTEKGTFQRGFLPEGMKTDLRAYSYANEGELFEHYISTSNLACQGSSTCFKGYKPIIVSYGSNEDEYLEDMPGVIKENLRAYVQELIDKGYTPIILPPVETDRMSSAREEVLAVIKELGLESVEDTVDFIEGDVEPDNVHLAYGGYLKVKEAFGCADTFGDSLAVGMACSEDSTYRARGARSPDAFEHGIREEKISDAKDLDILIENVPDRSEDLIPIIQDGKSSIQTRVILDSEIGDVESFFSRGGYDGEFVQTGVMNPSETSAFGDNWGVELNCQVNDVCDIYNPNGVGSTYLRKANDVYCSTKDSKCYDRLGDRVDTEGNYVSGSADNPTNCGDSSSPCESSFYKDSSTGVWAQKQEISLPFYSPTNQIEEFVTWAPDSCSQGGQFNCKIGEYNYRWNEDGTFSARDGDRFTTKGELIDDYGTYIGRDGTVCSGGSACAYSSQKSHFEGESINEVSSSEDISFNPTNLDVQLIRKVYGNDFLDGLEGLASRIEMSHEELIVLAKYGINNDFNLEKPPEAIGVSSYAMNEIEKMK